MKRQLTVHGPGGSSEGGRKTTCSSSSSKATLHPIVLPSAPTISTSLMASSAALRTISVTGSRTTTSMATVPENVADATFGSISIRYVSGSMVRGRRNAPEPGATGGVGPFGIS